jgi:RNA polymerase sigma-70 factor (ECF subfamily)
MNIKSSTEIFNEIYEEYYKKILQYFKKDFSNEDAEDLTQQTFMQLWSWIPNGYAVQNKKALIYRIAKNVKYDKFRKNALMLESMLLPETFDVQDANNFCKIIDLKLTISKLSPKEQQFLLLSLDGYNSTEIGKMLNVSSSAVRTRLQKIRNKIK